MLTLNPTSWWRYNQRRIATRSGMAIKLLIGLTLVSLTAGMSWVHPEKVSYKINKLFDLKIKFHILSTLAGRCRIGQH